MKKRFSKSWISSKQVRKQRKYRYNAPLHLRQKMLSAHLDKALRAEYNKRSVPVRVGDEVTIMRGDYSKKSGKITGVNLKKLKIFVENVKIKKVSGEEKQIPIDPSNVRITKLNIDDVKRKKMFTRKSSPGEKKASVKSGEKKTSVKS